MKICYKQLYVIQGAASADIRVFGHTCLFVMLLLIGLTLFYTPGVLCLAYTVYMNTNMHKKPAC